MTGSSIERMVRTYKLEHTCKQCNTVHPSGMKLSHVWCIARLKEQVERAEAALGIYVDRKNWSQIRGECLGDLFWVWDGPDDMPMEIARKYFENEAKHD